MGKTYSAFDAKIMTFFFSIKIAYLNSFVCPFVSCVGVGSI